MKIALEFEVLESNCPALIMRDVADRLGRLIAACRQHGAPAPSAVRLPPDLYFEASVTAARPAHGPESLLEHLLLVVPELREVKVDRHVERG